MVSNESRREILRFLCSVSTAGFAGCVTGGSGSSGNGDTTPSQERTMTTNMLNELSFSVTVVESFTDDHPGRIKIDLTNNHETPLAMGISHGIEGPVSFITGNHSDGEKQLVIFADPPEGHHETPPGAPCKSSEHAIPQTPTDGCWQPVCEFAKMYAHYAIKLNAGFTLSWPYVVLDGFNETCLPEGTYVFEETAPITFLESGETPGTTPSSGWSEVLTKRLQLTLSDDGSLTADAQLQLG